MTNNKFAGHFESWTRAASHSKKLTVVNDETVAHEIRLGDIGDIQYVVKQLKKSRMA